MELTYEALRNVAARGYPLLLHTHLSAAASPARGIPDLDVLPVLHSRLLEQSSADRSAEKRSSDWGRAGGRPRGLVGGEGAPEGCGKGGVLGAGGRKGRWWCGGRTEAEMLWHQ
eukprot:scaffold1517_cov397-Prasinococcus_capsulatus_cf.AAC.3